MKHLLLVFLGLSLTAGAVAQISYTDISPDSTVSATGSEQMKSYRIDLNNDGSYEFELRHFNPDPNNRAVELYQNIAGTQQVIIDGQNHARVLTTTDVIGPASAQWGLDMYGILNAPWYGSNDRYFGFRFRIAGEWHYGWARATMPANRSGFTIKDYAYNTVPNQPLTCGSTGSLGLHTVQPGQMTVYPNPAADEITVEVAGVTGKAIKIELYNISGCRVQTTPFPGNSKTARVDISSIPGGIYFITATSGATVLMQQRISINR